MLDRKMHELINAVGQAIANVEVGSVRLRDCSPPSANEATSHSPKAKESHLNSRERGGLDGERRDKNGIQDLNHWQGQVVLCVHATTGYLAWSKPAPPRSVESGN